MEAFIIISTKSPGSVMQLNLGLLFATRTMIVYQVCYKISLNLLFRYVMDADVADCRYEINNRCKIAIYSIHI